MEKEPDLVFVCLVGDMTDARYMQMVALTCIVSAFEGGNARLLI